MFELINTSKLSIFVKTKFYPKYHFRPSCIHMTIHYSVAWRTAFNVINLFYRGDIKAIYLFIAVIKFVVNLIVYSKVYLVIWI